MAILAGYLTGTVSIWCWLVLCTSAPEDAIGEWGNIWSRRFVYVFSHEWMLLNRTIGIDTASLSHNAMVSNMCSTTLSPQVHTADVIAAPSCDTHVLRLVKKVVRLLHLVVVFSSLEGS